MQIIIVYILLGFAVLSAAGYIFRKLRNLSGHTKKEVCQSCPLKDACKQECKDRKTTT